MKNKTNSLGERDPGGNPQECFGLREIQLIEGGNSFGFPLYFWKFYLTKPHHVCPYNPFLIFNMPQWEQRKERRVGAWGSGGKGRGEEDRWRVDASGMCDSQELDYRLSAPTRPPGRFPVCLCSLVPPRLIILQPKNHSGWLHHQRSFHLVVSQPPHLKFPSNNGMS